MAAMNLYQDLPLWADKEKGIVNVIVEIPQGSMVKYELNKKFNTIEVDRFFTAPMPMPYNYGLLPQSFNEEDGDPLDIIVPSMYAIQAGSILQAKVIGVLHMIDSGESDDKIIGIPLKEPFWGHIENIDEFPKNLKAQYEFFLSTYKNIDWKKTSVTGWSDRQKAIKIINKSAEAFLKKQ